MGWEKTALSHPKRQISILANAQHVQSCLVLGCQQEFRLYDLQIANCKAALGSNLLCKNTIKKFAIENPYKNWDLSTQVGKGFICT